MTSHNGTRQNTQDKDCKSADLRLRWFESSPAHHFSHQIRERIQGWMINDDPLGTLPLSESFGLRHSALRTQFLAPLFFFSTFNAALSASSWAMAAA